jgi:hypothetical protein
MNQRIHDKINMINNYIDINTEDNNNISLCNGIGALPIFYYLQFKLTNNKEYVDKIHDLITKIITIINENDVQLSYCNGLVGIAHLFNYIRKQDVLNPEALIDIEEALLIIDKNVADYYISHTKTMEDIDFLHGAFGAAFYLIERFPDNPDIVVKNKIIQLFEILSNIVLDDIKKTNSVNGVLDYTDDTHRTNCGLAHGHISFMIIFAKFVEKIPDNILVNKALQKSIECLLEFENNNDNGFSVFPGIAINKLTANYNTTLGWCYGDQAISLGLHIVSNVLEDKKIKDKALTLAYRNLARNTFDTIFSSPDKYDACFCHGLSSIAYIHKKWYSISKDENFYKEYEKLIFDVLILGDNKNGIAGYQKYQGGGTYIDSIGLLDGVIGIGIVLTDYLLELDDCGWDNFFLLDINN